MLCKKCYGRRKLLSGEPCPACLGMEPSCCDGGVGEFLDVTNFPLGSSWGRGRATVNPFHLDPSED